MTMEKDPANDKPHPIFTYIGINEYAQKLRGEIQAQDLLLAKLALRKQGVISPKLVKKRKALWRSKIHDTEITLLIRQIAMLIDAGIPLAKGLDILESSQINTPFKRIITRIHFDIKTGLTLADSLRKHPHYFNELFCNIIEVGEQSSTLNIILNDLVVHKEKVDALKKNLKKTLQYPCLLLVVACLVTSGLVLFVIPEFDSLFREFHATLPIYTQIIISSAEFFNKYWSLLSIIFCVFIYGLVYFKKHSNVFAKKIEGFLIKIPLIGTILKKTAIANFARTLLITFKAGVPLVKAVQCAAKASSNLLFREEIENIGNQIAVGESMYKAMSTSQLFPHIVIQMIAVGEEACALENMLNKIAEQYEEDVDQSVKALNHLLEPLLISLLGVLIGGLVIALYLPLFKLGQII